MVDIPNTTTSGLVLTSVGNGTNASKWGTAGSGGSGITALTGDVTASGTGSVAASVVRLQGQPVSSTAPTTNQLLIYNGSNWVPSAAPSVAGQVLTYNGVAWGPAAPATSTNAKARLYQSVSTSFNTTLSQVTNLTADYDSTGGLMTGTTNQLLAYYSGYYLVTAQVFFSSARAVGGYAVVTVNSSGTEILRNTAYSTAGAAPAISSVVSLSSGSAITMNCNIASGTSQATTPGTNYVWLSLTYLN